MSGMFGGGHSQSTTPQRYNGIQISSSMAGGCIPLLYGRQRLPFNLIWYGAFTSTANKTSSGGKGGGGQQTSSYTYKASFAAGICEGPITNIVTVWNDKDITTLTALGFTLFAGAGGQATWSYLTANFPAQAIPYDHICYVGAQNYLLGSSASLPNITFEVDGFLGQSAPITVTATSAPALGAVSLVLSTGWGHATGQWDITFSDGEERVGNFTSGGTAVTWTGGLINPQTTSTLLIGGAFDSDPSLFIPNYLTDPNHGAGFTGTIASLTGANSYQSYIQSLGLLLSPSETTQRSASDFMKETLQITNSDVVDSAGTLKILPYCDAPVSGNGFSFTPNLTPVFIFNDDDYIDPPELTRIATADTHNHVRVEYLDRSNEYNSAICEATDIGDIALTGERVMSTLNFHSITSSAVAQIVAQLILQTSLYERNSIKFKVRADYCLLEPMDYIGINDFGLGYVNQVFRIKKMTIDENDEIEIEALEIPGTVRSSALYAWQSVQGFDANFGALPPSVQVPAFMEAYGTLVDPAGGRQLLIAVNGPTSSTQWGGADVFMSFDGATYNNISTITSPSRYGIISSAVAAITAVPDVTTVMGVTLNNTLQVLNTGSASDARENRMLIAVGSGATLEIMSFQTATLVSAGHYNLTTIYRGLYGTTPQVHSIGAQFMRIDGNIFCVPLEPGWLGQTMHFKFCSFNTVGRALQDISAATDYTYTPSQSAIAYNSTSNSTFVASGNAVVYSPTTAFKTTTSAAAWDSSIYSVQSFTNGCTASCYASQTTLNLALALVNDPTVGNAFANIQYGFQMTPAGVLNIVEAGVFVAVFGTYTNSSLLSISYDGKHVAYYNDGVLLRSIPVSNQTFSMQVFFFDPSASVYGLSFENVATAVTPFTLVPMSLNVAAQGTRVIANALGANGFGTKNFQSAESYTNGAQLSFQVNPLGDAQFIGFSKAPATGDTTGLVNTLAGWYPHAASSTCQILFNGSSLGAFGAYATLSDIFTITYDNFTFRWWRNGTIVHLEYFPNAGVLFLFGDFYEPNQGFINISFGPYGQLSPNPFYATGTASVHDSTAMKITGPGGIVFDSAIYSFNAYATAHAQFKATDATKLWVMGLSTLPTPSATQIYSWFMGGTAAVGGTGWRTFELGTVGAVGPDPLVTDLAAVTYDGTNVNYLLNGVVMKTTAVSVAAMYAAGSLASVGAAINSLSFGPGIGLDTIPTISFDPNAATTVSSVAVSNVTINSSVTNTPSNITSITMGPFPVLTTIVITVTGVWTNDHTFPVGSLSYDIVTTSPTTFSPSQIAINPLVADQVGLLSQEKLFSLAAGVTQIYYLNSLGDPPTGTTHFVVTQAVMKAEVIKR